MSVFGLRRRREDRLRQLVALPQAGRQLDAADTPAGLILLPAAAGQIAANDALDRHDLGLAAEHRAAVERGSQVRRDNIGRGGDQMMRDTARERLEPEERQGCQDAALVGNAAGHNDVERRDAISGDDQQLVTKVIDIADLPASHGNAGPVRFEDDGRTHLRRAPRAWAGAAARPAGDAVSATVSSGVVMAQARATSATDQAWPILPRGVCGGS